MNRKNIAITQEHIVPKLEIPVRLQEYGVGIFEAAFTKSALKKALKKKYISVDGKIATTAIFINGGEHICFTQIVNPSSHRKLIFPLKVLFEDDYLAAIHKPAGILVSGNTFKSIVKALPQNLMKSELPDACHPQPVHRLDYATTGILLIGKTSTSIRALNKLFQQKTIDKIYYAIAIGKMKAEGKITSEIDGKRSETIYTICDCVASERFGSLNLVKLEPKTGKRHQLRKHLASMGNPILGDKDYGAEGLILNGKGLYLHALSLEFIHPFTEEKIHLTDEFPKRFNKIFDLLK